jgi:hypothetical protein
MNSNGKPVCYCHYDIELGFHIDINSYIASGSNIYPATKEQRDLLFKKMKEAGYEWDAEKKELKKIEDDSKNCKQQIMSEITSLVTDYIKQKPAWSEEDERNLKGIIDEIEANKASAPSYDIETYDRFLSWLKSLKNKVASQNKWKPSEEQMQALKETCDKHWEPDGLYPLYTLYEQLKKL